MFTYHSIPLSNCFLLFLAAMNLFTPCNWKTTRWMVQYYIMCSILFYSACLFSIFIGGCWCFGCLLIKSSQKEKLVRIFGLVSSKIYGFLMWHFDWKIIMQFGLVSSIIWLYFGILNFDIFFLFIFESEVDYWTKGTRGEIWQRSLFV